MPEPPERVVLVGFMGAGKSTIGPLVARDLGWDFLDMDTRIEEKAGCPIADVFRDQGEPAFRALELEVAEEAASRPRLVIAAGGGAFAQPATREVLQTSALTVWLRCNWATLTVRVPADGRRPLATNRAIMRSLLTERESSYQLADVAVEASEGTAESIARRVIERLATRGIEGSKSAG
ncbi:MAG TPA: shikimate kinase [Vicinamibacteria bacterium]|nr:shikimate kinase [Vicinamibacteria bacterium]